MERAGAAFRPRKQSSGVPHDLSFLPLLVVASVVAEPQEGPPELPIHAGYAAFSPSAPPRLPAALAKPLLRDGGFEPGYFLVHLPGESAGAVERLEALALGPTPGPGAVRWRASENTLGLWIDDLRALLALRRSAVADWAGRYEPGYKLDPALSLDPFEEAPLRLDVELIPGHPSELVRRGLEDLGVPVLEPDTFRAGRADLLVVEAPPRDVPRIAWVEGIHRLLEHDDAPRHAASSATGGAHGRGREKSSAPITATLAVREGRHSDDGTLGSSNLARLRSADDSRYTLGNREKLTLGFDRSVPPDAVVSAIRLFVEHHEDERMGSGEVLWKLARGSLSSPVVVQTTSAPLRLGQSREALDVWRPSSLVDPDELRIVIANDSRNDDALLDRVYVEVDYVLPASAPEITSTPAARGVRGEAYRYDADGKAEASGTAPLVWSVASGPADFKIVASTGEVRWTPSTSGSFPVTIRVANAEGVELQPFTVEVSPLPSTLVPANAQGLVYCPPERLARGPAKQEQRLNVFLPRGTPPPAGWPVVLDNRAGGGLPATPLPALYDTGGTAPLWDFVASGIAVVDFGVTPIGSGQGLFFPPGHPSGRYESFAPADDNPEKDAEWAVQWLKTQSAFPLDEERICLRGSSHGAIISIWAAMGPERARSSGSAQVRASTRVRAILALQPPTSVWAFDQGSDLDVRMKAHFEQQANPGVPATAFGQVAEGLQKAASVMGFAFATEEARENNASQALCLVYSEPVLRVGGAPADMTLDAQGFPRLHDRLAQPYIHDSWAGYVFYKRLLGLSPRSAAFHELHSRFAVRDTSALPAPYAFHTHTYSGGIRDSGANAVAHEWVLQALGVTPSPLLTGSGTRGGR